MPWVISLGWKDRAQKSCRAMAAGVLLSCKDYMTLETPSACPVFRTYIGLDSQKALMQIHLAVPTEESCENCHNSTEIIFLSCFNGLVPCWSTQRSWLLSPLENKAIKKPQSRHPREKPPSRFLSAVNWLHMEVSFSKKKALRWPCTAGSHISVSAWSWWGCLSLLELLYILVMHFCCIFGVFWSVLICVWTQLHPQVNCREWVSWNLLLRMRHLFTHSPGAIWAAFFSAKSTNLSLWFSPRTGS